MAENIPSRVKRIIAGGIDALVTAVEDAAPAVVMEQAIAEVDRAIDDVRADLGRLVAQKHLTAKELTEKNRRHEELGERIELAIGEGRDDLAEAAIGRQIDIEAQFPILENNLAETGEKEKELEGYILALQAKRREMEADLQAALAAVSEAGAAAAGAPPAAGSGAKVENASRAFDRAMAAGTGLGLERALDLEADASLAELEALARGNRVKERLEAVKARSKSAPVPKTAELK